MDVARLNFSHGTHEEHAETARARARGRRPRRAPGRDPRRTCPARRSASARSTATRSMLRGGDAVTFITRRRRHEPGTRRAHDASAGPASPPALEPGESVYLADGSVRLRVTRGARGRRRVRLRGRARRRRRLAPGPEHPRPAPRSCPRCPRRTSSTSPPAISIGVDLVALSFVRRPEDVLFVREHTRIPLIAKIEKPQAVARAEDIIRVSDGIMVARGDLGIELPIQEVPLVQKRLLRLAGEHARIVDHRDADARLDDPQRAPDARRGRRRRQRDPRRHRRGDALAGDRGRRLPGRGRRDDGLGRAHDRARGARTRAGTSTACAATGRDPGYTIAHSVVEAARELELDAIVVPTLSGRSARLVSAHRPTVPILALSPGKETVRRCGLMWGVRAASMRRHEVTEELIADAARRVVELGWCQPGQRVGITAGPAERPARDDEPVPGPAPRRSGPSRARAQPARRDDDASYAGSPAGGAPSRLGPLAQQVAPHQHQPDDAHRHDDRDRDDRLRAERSPNEPPSAM